ncbi:hypothetical protein KJ973_01595 [Patescibacteria group bacterium]|nr:hypothetical protein [Patescibacteria group bacterium]MBU1519370.1 hypothetical protein [Patescibacteria group bacterium]MBU1730451.1 hypothetical protein [Patescibacteria group bacterium]MBU2416801.1 hypothetical protein [Patescibacteria group bacterium]MBU2460879.1 hypothetical protein [Patescibacteria group bacterium]
MNDAIIKVISYVKPICLFFKKGYSKFRNRNKFFVEDYKDFQEKEFYYSKKIGENKYGVFCNKNRNVIRIYQKPEHNNPKKLSKQYAKKLAWKKANNIN